MSNNETSLNKYQQIIITIIALIVVIGVVVSLNAALLGPWIAGQYGTKCYMEGTEHENIKYRVYFDTIEECLSFVNK